MILIGNQMVYSWNQGIISLVTIWLHILITYIFTKSYTIVNQWHQNLKFDKTYLPKGCLILVIPEIVSIDHVQYQNPQLYSTEIMLWILRKWKLRWLKVEKWVLVIHITISNVVWFVMAVTTILIVEPDKVRKDVLVVSCLATFIFSVVSYGLWDFPTVPIDPQLFFKSWHPTVVIEGQFTPVWCRVSVE